MVIFRMTHRVSVMFSSFSTSFTNTLPAEPHNSIWWEDGDKPSYKGKKINMKIVYSYLLTYFQSFIMSSFYLKILFENIILCILRKHKYKLGIISSRAAATNLIHFNLNPHRFILDSSTSGIHNIFPKSTFINI